MTDADASAGRRSDRPGREHFDETLKEARIIRYTIAAGLISSWVLALLIFGTAFVRPVVAPMIIWIASRMGWDISIQDVMYVSVIVAGWIACIYSDLQTFQVLSRTATDVKRSIMDVTFSALPLGAYMVVVALWYAGTLSLGVAEWSINSLFLYRAIVDMSAQNWTSTRVLARTYGIDPLAGR